MAITERGGRWLVELVSSSGAAASKSFSTYGRAKAWETRNRNAAARYGDARPTLSPETTLAELLERYGREVSSLKRGAVAESYKLAMLARSALGCLTVDQVTSQAIATYRNERLASAANSTVRTELSLLRQTIETARREWGLGLSVNPVSLVTAPEPGPPRDRRLREGEWEALEWVLSDHPAIWAYVQMAVETAMRRGELLALQWENVRLAQGTLHIPMSKNGAARTVPLTDKALQVLSGLPHRAGRVFDIDPHALRWAWTQACEMANIADLRMHDLRHEGVSRLFELGLSVPEVASISGHKTAAMLFRYTHPNAAAIRQKLKGRTRA